MCHVGPEPIIRVGISTRKSGALLLLIQEFCKSYSYAQELGYYHTMKGRKLFAVLAVAMMACGSTDAQNLLGRLAESAKNAAENAVNSAVSKIPGNKQSSKASSSIASSGSYDGIVTTRGTYPEGSDPFMEFVDELAPSIELTNYESYFPEVGEVQPKKFSSISEAVKAYPKLPAAAQIVSGDPAPAKAILEFKGTAIRMNGNTTISSIDAFKREAAAMSKTNKATAAQMAQVQGTAMETFRLMDKYGVDPDKMSEAELMDFMRKRAASGELKLPDGLSVSDLVDEPETDDDKLSAKIDEFVEKVNDLVISNTLAVGPSVVNPAIKSEFDEIKASWKDSDSYRNVYEIEKDIDKRALDYFHSSPEYSNGVDIDYPPFWVEGRKKENTIINDFNTANAVRWVKVLQSELDKYLPLLDELAKLDSEIDAMYPDRQSTDNLIYKNNLGQAFMGVSSLIDPILEKAYAMPCVGAVAESDVMAMGM